MAVDDNSWAWDLGLGAWEFKASDNHGPRVGVDLIAVDLIRRHPGHRVGIRPRHRFAARGPADKVDDHEVITNPAGVIAMDAVEGFDDRAQLDIEPGLLLDFT